MTSNEPSKAPTHRVSAVVKKENGENVWLKIGALWPHKDGKGYSMKLDLLPRGDAELVIRTIEDKQTAQIDQAEGGAA
jgi:hypothetical protein